MTQFRHILSGLGQGRWAGLLLAIVIAPAQPSEAQSTPTPVTIAFISDFPYDQAEPFLTGMVGEIRAVLGPGYNVSFDPTLARFNGQAPGRSLEEYMELVADGRATVVVSVGVIATQELAAVAELPLPVVGIGVFDPGIQAIPLQPDGTSGKTNFTFLHTPQEIDSDLRRFLDLHPFKKVAVVMARETAGSADWLGGFRSAAERLGVALQFLPAGQDLVATAAEIDADVDAVYVPIIYERTPEAIAALATQLMEQKLTSFGSQESHVNAGLVMAIDNGVSTPSIWRKLATQVERIVSGEQPDELSVRMPFKNQLVLNVLSSRKVGYSPSFETIFGAKLVDADLSDTGIVYSLEQVVALALADNLDLRATQYDSLLTEQDVRQARAAYIPSLDASATALQVDRDTARGAAGKQAERTMSGGLTLTQLLFSNNALLGLRANRAASDAQAALLDQAALDTILDAVTAYINVAMARTSVAIRDQFLQLSQQNQAIAERRSRVGAASRADLYRWDSEVANSQQAVFSARTQLWSSKIVLAALLNRDTQVDFDIETEELPRIVEQYRIDRDINDLASYEAFTAELVAVAKRTYPQLEAVRNQLRILDEQVATTKRAYYLPQLALQGQTDYVFGRWGVGKDAVPTVPRHDWSWNVGVSATLPLFAGNSRKVDLDRARYERAQLSAQERAATRGVEQLVGLRLTELARALTNIRNTETAAEAAQRSFDLVQGAYGKGQVSITELLDAQNASFSARQSESIAQYEYLLAYFNLEYATGAFSLFQHEGLALPR